MKMNTPINKVYKLTKTNYNNFEKPEKIILSRSAAPRYFTKLSECIRILTIESKNF